eukprot:5669106-Amphidinium_carterae.1
MKARFIYDVVTADVTVEKDVSWCGVKTCSELCTRFAQGCRDAQSMELDGDCPLKHQAVLCHMWLSFEITWAAMLNIMFPHSAGLEAALAALGAGWP